MRNLMITAATAALFAAGATGSVSAADFGSRNSAGVNVVAQANPMPANAPQSIQEDSLDENPNQTSGKITQMSTEARTIHLEDGQVLGVTEGIDMALVKVGDSVLLTVEADTNMISRLARDEKVPTENDPAAPLEGATPTIEKPAG